MTISSPLILAAIIAGCVALAFWLEAHVRFLGKLGASMLAIILGALLSNTGVVPATSSVYEVVGGPLTSLSIAWLLLAVDLRDLRKAGPRMVGAFALAVLGTMVGALVAAFAYGHHFADDTWRMVGALAGTYSGGSVNFVSVARAVDLSGPLFTALNAADAVVTGLWLMATLALPVRFLGWRGRSPGRDVEDRRIPGGIDSGERRQHPYFQGEEMSALSIAQLLGLGFALLVVADLLGAVVPQVPSILWLTTLALVVGHLPFFSSPPGAMALGSVGLHGFFVLIGIMSRFSDIAAVGGGVFFLTVLVVAVHGLIVFGAGTLLRLDMATLAVASQAAVGGPSSALAVATSRQWRQLVLPGVAAGLLGYAVGTYLGLGVAHLLR